MGENSSLVVQVQLKTGKNDKKSEKTFANWTIISLLREKSFAKFKFKYFARNAKNREIHKSFAFYVLLKKKLFSIM